MTTVNANVTPGYTFVYDANGEFQITLDRLNLVANPIVTVDLSGQVNTNDIVASSVTAAKLADGVADEMLTATATVSVEVANVVSVTVQMQDIQGNNLADQCVVEYWLSDTAAEALTGDTFTGGGVAATTGIIVKELTTDTHAVCITDAAGLLVLTFTETNANTLYFNLIVNNKYVAGSRHMTWTT